MTDYRREYGNRVRAARVAAGLSQRDLAEALVCTQPQVCRIERGSRTHSVEELLAVARATGCDPCWLLTGQDPPAPPYAPEPTLETR
jgi:transcriptional regulator with XRE-family HTH domain